MSFDSPLFILESIVIAGNPIERSYCLAPMQRGMLFHSLSAADDSAYVAQVVCESSAKEYWRRLLGAFRTPVKVESP